MPTSNARKLALLAPMLDDAGNPPGGGGGGSLPVWNSFSPVLKAGATVLTYGTLDAGWLAIGSAVLWYIRARNNTVGGTGVVTISGLPTELQDDLVGVSGQEIVGTGEYMGAGVGFYHVDVRAGAPTQWTLVKYDTYLDLNVTVGAGDELGVYGFVRHDV